MTPINPDDYFNYGPTPTDADYRGEAGGSSVNQNQTTHYNINPGNVKAFEGGLQKVSIGGNTEWVKISKEQADQINKEGGINPDEYIKASSIEAKKEAYKKIEDKKANNEGDIINKAQQKIEKIKGDISKGEGVVNFKYNQGGKTHEIIFDFKGLEDESKKLTGLKNMLDKFEKNKGLTEWENYDFKKLGGNLDGLKGKIIEQEANVNKIKSSIENSHRVFDKIRENFNKADTVLNTSQSLDYDVTENNDINFNQADESKKDLFKKLIDKKNELYSIDVGDAGKIDSDETKKLVEEIEGLKKEIGKDGYLDELKKRYIDMSKKVSQEGFSQEFKKVGKALEELGEDANKILRENSLLSKSSQIENTKNLTNTRAQNGSKYFFGSNINENGGSIDFEKNIEGLYNTKGKDLQGIKQDVSSIDEELKGILKKKAELSKGINSIKNIINNSGNSIDDIYNYKELSDASKKEIESLEKQITDIDKQSGLLNTKKKELNKIIGDANSVQNREAEINKNRSGLQKSSEYEINYNSAKEKYMDIDLSAEERLKALNEGNSILDKSIGDKIAKIDSLKREYTERVKNKQISPSEEELTGEELEKELQKQKQARDEIDKMLGELKEKRDKIKGEISIINQEKLKNIKLSEQISGGNKTLNIESSSTPKPETIKTQTTAPKTTATTTNADDIIGDVSKTENIVKATTKAGGVIDDIKGGIKTATEYGKGTLGKLQGLIDDLRTSGLAKVLEDPKKTELFQKVMKIANSPAGSKIKKAIPKVGAAAQAGIQAWNDVQDGSVTLDKNKTKLAGSILASAGLGLLTTYADLGNLGAKATSYGLEKVAGRNYVSDMVDSTSALYDVGKTQIEKSIGDFIYGDDGAEGRQKRLDKSLDDFDKQSEEFGTGRDENSIWGTYKDEQIAKAEEEKKQKEEQQKLTQPQPQTQTQPQQSLSKYGKVHGRDVYKTPDGKYVFKSAQDGRTRVGTLDEVKNMIKEGLTSYYKNKTPDKKDVVAMNDYNKMLKDKELEIF